MTEVAEKTKSQPRLFRLSRTDYYRMANLGFFNDQAVELIDGKVFAMPPRGDRHEASVGMVVRRLMKAFGDDFWVRPQMSLHLAPRSAPEPDAAVVHGAPEQMMPKPTSALLVVEVSEATLAFDQGRKSGLYASSALSE
jgi:Uma2 family endonuclease